jgi:hypothetical protein
MDDEFDLPGRANHVQEPLGRGWRKGEWSSWFLLRRDLQLIDRQSRMVGLASIIDEVV